jgi:hypothetical protein
MLPPPSPSEAAEPEPVAAETCPHQKVKAAVDVRQSNLLGRQRWSAEVVVLCARCGKPFTFPSGSDSLLTQITEPQ